MDNSIISYIFSFQNHLQTKLIPENPQLLNFVVLGLIIIFTFFPYKKGTNSQEILDRQITTAIKGFAIMQIVIGHLNYYVIGSEIKIWGIGGFGVSIFLFLSGFGLCESFKNKGLTNFFEKRFLRVYVPFFIANLLIIFLDYILLGKSLGTYFDYFLYFIGYRTSTGNFWFIHYIFLWYFMFYLTFAFFEKETSRLLSIFLCSIVPFFFVNHQHYWEVITILVFPFGVFVSLYKHRFMVFFAKLDQKKLLNKLVIITLFIVCYKYLGGSSIPKIEIISTFAQSLRQLIITFFYISILVVIFRNKLSLFFLFIGEIGFELYLLHGSFMYSYDFIMFKFPLIWSFPLYLLCLILLAYCLKNICSKISSKLSNYLIV